MITHRPSSELILGYAAGSLAEPAALVVAAHAALCPETAAEIRRLEGLGGSLLGTLDPASLRADALERTLAMLDQDAAAAPDIAAVTAETRALLPSPVWPYVKGDLRHLEWRRRGPQIETAALIGDGKAQRAFLLRVKGGHAVPRHTHRGTELTLVLQGAFCDAANCFAPGDIQVADPTIDHQPVAQRGKDCICLVALEAPIWFTGPIGRLANHFVKL